MALKAGRVGVAPDQVDEFGKINSEATEGYTKQEADAKFETQSHAASTYETKSEAAALQPIQLSVPVELLNGSALTVENALEGIKDDSLSGYILGFPSAARSVSNGTTVSVSLSNKIYPLNSGGNSTYLVIAYKYGHGLPTAYIIAFMASQHESAKLKVIKADGADDMSLDISKSSIVDTITLTATSAAYMNLAVYKIPLNPTGYDYMLS